jgi:hypothetical protein
LNRIECCHPLREKRIEVKVEVKVKIKEKKVLTLKSFYYILYRLFLNLNLGSRTSRHPIRLIPQHRVKRCILLLILWILVMVSSSFAQTDDVKHYLLMEEIQDAFKNVKLFKSISTAKISVNLESPLILHGYLPIDKFIDDFALEFSRFETLDIEWVSIQLEEEFTVQSLVLVLKDKQSEKTVYYKLIFFLIKKDKEWKIYYLRGLKI